MKFPKPQSLKEIATIISADFIGDENFQIHGINEIHRVEEGDIVFVDHPKYYEKALQSAATTILINKEVECPEGKALLISDDPFRDFLKIGQHFNPFQPSEQMIDPSAKIGKNTIIQPNVFIGKNVVIGDNCLVHSNVTLHSDTIIEHNVIINSGTVIGGDGFYYKNRPEGYDKLKSVGGVWIEDDVEIGSNCTIDKGVTAYTIIGKGTKIDNLVQIGHDTIIGKKCLIAAQSGIAGCVVMEDEVVVWGQVGVISGLKVGKGAVLTAQTGVSKSVDGGKAYAGTPAEEIRTHYKKLAALNYLPDIIKKK